MTTNEFNAIRARCEAAKELSECFRKVINSFDPVANSTMTEETLPVKILADWGRKACDVLEKSDSSACLDEIERRGNALRKIITESGKVDIDNWPAQQQICQAIARKVLEDV